MPHVVIEEAGDLQGLYQAFTPIIQRVGTGYSESPGVLSGTKR